MKITTILAGPDDAHMIEALESVLQSRAEPHFAERLFAAGRDVVVALADDKPAGYVVLNPEPSYALFQKLNVPELQDLNVLPDLRRNGIGEVLVKACENQARVRGAAQIGVGVGLDKSYGAAQRLYVRLGYMPDGMGITYDRESVSAGQMRAVDDNLCLMMIKDL